MWEKLKRFGTNHYDLPTMLWSVTTMLRTLALNVDPNYHKPINPLAYVWLLAIIVSYYYVYLLSMFWFVFVRCRETGDLLAGIIVLSLGCSSEISMTKLICLFLKRNKMRTIIEAYLICDAGVAPNTRFANNLMSTLKIVKKRVIIVWNVIIWNGIIYVVMALVKPGRHFMEDAFIFYGFEPMTESPKYEIAFTMNVIGVYATCFPAANVTSLFIIIAGYTEAQMLALSIELVNLWPDAMKHKAELNLDRNQRVSNTYEKEIVNKFIKNKLKDIWKGHTTHLYIVRQLEDVFRGAIAIEFMLLIAGIIAELLGGLEKTFIQLPYALMLVGTDCFIGQRIIDASFVFEKAVYDSQWENFDVANRKIVLLMLRNSQRKMKLSAGGVATLSLECLMAICRMTYSAYTTLRTTMHHD